MTRHIEHKRLTTRRDQNNPRIGEFCGDKMTREHAVSNECGGCLSKVLFIKRNGEGGGAAQFSSLNYSTLPLLTS